MKSKKREVYEQAVRLAQSGKMKNWQGIQEHLLAKGYKRAPNLLDSEKIRAVLDICCESSRNAEQDYAFEPDQRLHVRQLALRKIVMNSVSPRFADAARNAGGIAF